MTTDTASTEGAKRAAEESAEVPAAKTAKVEEEKKGSDDKKEKKEKKDKDKDKKEKKDKPGKSGGEQDAQALDHRKNFKPGQKFLTPPVADSTRAFYESLLEENPDSKIAIRFCVEYGLLSMEEHDKLFKKYTKLKEKSAFSASGAVKKLLDKKFSGQKLGKDKKDKKGDKEKKEKKEKKDSGEKTEG